MAAPHRSVGEAGVILFLFVLSLHEAGLHAVPLPVMVQHKAADKSDGHDKQKQAQQEFSPQKPDFRMKHLVKRVTHQFNSVNGDGRGDRHDQQRHDFLSEQIRHTLFPF
jgi:hypothetical protein